MIIDMGARVNSDNICLKKGKEKLKLEQID